MTKRVTRRTAHWIWVRWKRIQPKGTGAGQWVWRRVRRKPAPAPSPVPAPPKPTPPPPSGMAPLLKTAGKYAVEQGKCPATGPVNLHAPRAGVLHTTEGSFESAYAEFRTRYAPHFLLGRDKAGKVRIVQFVSLGNYASALENHPGGVETNTIAVAQIELVGFSKTTPWQADAGVSDALASLMAELHTVCGIPLTRPFPDAMPPQPWAVESFSRRHAGKWGNVAGWYGHVEIPENSHWDPGAYKWSQLLDLARKKTS